MPQYAVMLDDLLEFYAPTEEDALSQARAIFLDHLQNNDPQGFGFTVVGVEDEDKKE